MANYPLTAMNKEGTLLRSNNSYYSDEYAESMCDLFLRDCVVKDEHGKLHKYYRLHAKQAHNTEMALAYDIRCPECHSGMLKQIGRQLSYNELGLYRCPVCDKK
jgi:Zn finger protein HypA/HybF involved in hydrogenase expression